MPVSVAIILNYCITFFMSSYLYPSNSLRIFLISFCSASDNFSFKSLFSNISQTSLSALYPYLVLESVTNKSVNLSTCPDAFKIGSGVMQVVEISNISSSIIKCSLQYYSTLFLIAQPSLLNLINLLVHNHKGLRSHHTRQTQVDI